LVNNRSHVGAREPLGPEEARLRSRVTELPSGTVTFLFTDIEESTTLLRTLGDGYAELVREHRRVLSEIAEGSGGVVYGAFADEISAVFRTPAEAVATASSGQRSFAAASLPGGVKVRVRMGIHTGRPVAGAGEYLGLDVHRTARICSAGHGGQVLLSEAARNAFADASPVGVAFRDLGTHELKGLPEPERLFQLLITGARNEFPPLRVGALSPELPDFPGRPGELVRSLQAALTRLRTRRLANTLEHDQVSTTERFVLPATQLLEDRVRRGRTDE
jgi:class 3 adenylate cyclase